MIVIAQCTNQKRDEQCRAKEMYMPSDLFKAQRRYAEAYADEWYILSGNYGLIRPSKYIEPYDQHIKNHDDMWNEQVGIRCRVIADESQQVQIIAGKEQYGRRLEYWFDDYDVDYTYPFEGMGIGTRTKAMKQEARKMENNQLGNYAP